MCPFISVFVNHCQTKKGGKVTSANNKTNKRKYTFLVTSQLHYRYYDVCRSIFNKMQTTLFLYTFLLLYNRPVIFRAVNSQNQAAFRNPYVGNQNVNSECEREKKTARRNIRRCGACLVILYAKSAFPFLIFIKLATVGGITMRASRCTCILPTPFSICVFSTHRVSVQYIHITITA